MKSFSVKKDEIPRVVENTMHGGDAIDQNSTEVKAARSVMKFHLPIIVYHCIDHYGTSMSVTPSIFEQQIRYLAEHGWSSIGLSQVGEMLREGRKPSRKSVVLTFDDAMSSVLEYADPILQNYGMTGTTFVVTGQVGQNPEWYRLHPRYRAIPLLSRRGLDCLAEHGWEIHPHTHEHPVLTHLPVDMQVEQILKSRECIRSWFGTAGDVLAYPFGQCDASTREAMRQSDMSIGLTLRFSVRMSTDDYFDWPRIGSAWFKRSKLRQGLALCGILESYVKLRQKFRGDRSKFFLDPTDETTRGLCQYDH